MQRPLPPDENIPAPVGVPTPKYGPIAAWCLVSGMKPSTTYAALRDGHLKAIKMGRRTLIDFDAGLAWLAQRPAWAPTGPVAERRSKRS